MQELVLERQSYTDKSIIGTLYLDGEVICNTLELPWVENARGISCIPSGVYELESHKWKGRLNTVCLVNEELGVTHYKEEGNARDTILIHIGNSPKDINGCIALGYMGVPEDSVVRSKDAFRVFASRVLANPAIQTIRII